MHRGMKRLLWLAALAACGSSSPASPDAPPPDVPADVGPIRVFAPYPRTGDAFTPTPGATALFYDAAGHVVDRQLTDSQGMATGMAPADSSVTVVPPASADQTYYTWIDVSPGDHLATTDTPGPIADVLLTSVTLPRAGDDVTSYVLSGVDFGGSTMMPPATGNIVIDASLNTEAPTVGDVVAVANHGSSSTFLVAHGVTLDAATIDLSSLGWSPGSPVDTKVSGIADDTQWLTAYYQVLAGSSVVWQERMLDPHPTATFDMPVQVPDSAGDSRGVQLFFQRGAGSFWALSYNQPGPAIDLGTLVPSAFNITQQDHTVSWEVAGQTGGAAAVRLDFPGPAATWRVVMPPEQRTFSPPVIPADLPGPQSLYTPRVTYVGGNAPGGYAAVRTDPLIFDLYRYGQQMPATPGIYRLAGG
jgi:hypothetical protein